MVNKWEHYLAAAGTWYQGYRGGDDHQDYIRDFRDKYGALPEKVTHTGGGVLLGPITPRMVRYREQHEC